MSDFAAWLQWCGKLNAEDRALVWLGMGIVRGETHLRRSRRYGYEQIRSSTSDAESLIALILKDALNHNSSDQGVRWLFPANWNWRYRDPTDLLPPEQWLHLTLAALRDEVENSHRGTAEDPSPVRVRVGHRFLRDATTNWLALLKSCPWPLAITEELYASASPVFRWPLRLAFATPSGLAACTEARKRSPSRRLTEAFELSRDRSNADVLVHTGSLRSLLSLLLDRPYKAKANIVVVEHAGSLRSTDIDLEFAANALSASAVIELPHGLSAEILGDRINRFVEEVSHDNPFDVALAMGFGKAARIWTSSDLAGYRLSIIAREMAQRIDVLPPETRVDTGGISEDILTQLTPGVDQKLGAREIGLVLEKMAFDHEPQRASDLVDVSKALAMAILPEEAIQSSAARFLQQQSFRMESGEVPALGGFRVGTLCAIHLRIGLPDAEWQSLSRPFPAPPTLEYSNLTVWLTEPDQLPEAVSGTMKLFPQGNSEVCRLEFLPRRAGKFDGRISVLHRGRILQTAKLVANVLEEREGAESLHGGTPTLRELASVRQRLGELADRRQFDLSFVTNHLETGESRAVVLSDDRAWIASLDAASDIIKEINTSLSKMARSAREYVKGLDGDPGRKLLIELANQGSYLKINLVKEQLRHSANNGAIERNEYIQVVSTRSDSVVPFEFIYEYPAPRDDAALCPQWRDAVSGGRCPQTCSLPSSEPGADHVCPMGFWGLRKVIERHQLSPNLNADGKELFLQSEPGRKTRELELKGQVVLAASLRVPKEGRDKVLSTISEFSSFVTAQTVTTWEQWKDAVVKHQPRLILSMPHTDGVGANVSLEIEGSAIKASHLSNKHVRFPDASAGPLVTLLGCDLAETLHDYSHYIGVFRDRGAAVVVATIATVSGRQAPIATAALIRSLLRRKGDPFFLGEAIREMRREALLDGELMPLGVVAYGDADWKLKVGV